MQLPENSILAIEGHVEPQFSAVREVFVAGFEQRYELGAAVAVYYRDKLVLMVGTTGSIGQLVVEEGIRQGHAVRALVRNASKAHQFPREAETVIGDLTRPETLSAVVDGIDAILFTHGSDGGGKAASEAVDYGVRNILPSSPRLDRGQLASH